MFHQFNNRLLIKHYINIYIYTSKFENKHFYCIFLCILMLKTKLLLLLYLVV